MRVNYIITQRPKCRCTIALLSAHRHAIGGQRVGEDSSRQGVGTALRVERRATHRTLARWQRAQAARVEGVRAASRLPRSGWRDRFEADLRKATWRRCDGDEMCLDACLPRTGRMLAWSHE